MKPSETLAFENAYEGTPTWETGRPQPAVLRALERGLIRGGVLDVGCGTGRHARLLADHGHTVLGVDFAARAIERALAGQPTTARFAVADARTLDADADLRAAFDTVLDVGCFHTLQPADRPAYARAVRATLRLGGRLVLLCWSDRNPFGYGPARIQRRDIRATFRRGWALDEVREETLESRLESARIRAWLAVARAVEPAQVEPAQAEPAQAEHAALEPGAVEPAAAESAQVESAQAEPAALEPGGRGAYGRGVRAGGACGPGAGGRGAYGGGAGSPGAAPLEPASREPAGATPGEV